MPQRNIVSGPALHFYHLKADYVSAVNLLLCMQNILGSFPDISVKGTEKTLSSCCHESKLSWECWLWANNLSIRQLHGVMCARHRPLPNWSWLLWLTHRASCTQVASSHKAVKLHSRTCMESGAPAKGNSLYTWWGWIVSGGVAALEDILPRTPQTLESAKLTRIIPIM